MFRNLTILGASRGLGAAVGKYASTHFLDLERMTLMSRKTEQLQKVCDEIKTGHERDHRQPFDGKIEVVSADLSHLDGQEKALTFINNESDLVIYSAGGGPHGEFAKKDFKDHDWSLNVNLIAPMRIAHGWLERRNKSSTSGRFVIVGSRIAEQNPDPMATSYAAGKHGLYGFVSSLQLELEQSINKVWLFSPGYMNSTLLPMTAKVRHDGSKLMSVETAAQGMLRWLKKDGPWHRVLN